MNEEDQLPSDGPHVDQPEPGPTAETQAKGEHEPIASNKVDQVEIRGDPVAVALDEARGVPLAVDGTDLFGSTSPVVDAAEPKVLAGAETAATDGEPDALAPAARSLYFLTNRMNLNGVLSSRLVAPRESFQKYYADLLQQAPGWVPLLRQAPTRALIEAVTSERGAGAPVLIEFPHKVAGLSSGDESVVYVPAVALSDAIAIHLSSERDLREHRARGYSNVHAHDDLLRVTPELFESSEAEPPTLTLPGAPLEVDWRRVDRVRGAFNAALVAANSGEQLALVAAILGPTKLPAAVRVPEWLVHSDIEGHAGPDAHKLPDSALPDYLAFRATYDVLGERDVAESWSPNEVLDAVEARVSDAGLSNDAAEAIFRNLQRVRSIVNAEADFEPFHPSARGLISAKALLLVLLRPELDQLLAWPDDETGADDATRMVAAVFAGRLRGLSRESTELRSLAVDDLTAKWAVRVASGRPTSLGRTQIVANSRGTSLKVDGVEVSVRSALLPDLVSKYGKLSEAKKEATRVRVSRVMGWPVEHRIRVPTGATVEPGQSVIVIATPADVVVTVAVDEDGFLRRLEALTGRERQHASEAFSARR